VERLEDGSILKKHNRDLTLIFYILYFIFELGLNGGIMNQQDGHEWGGGHLTCFIKTFFARRYRYEVITRGTSISWVVKPQLPRMGMSHSIRRFPP